MSDAGARRAGRAGAAPGLFSREVPGRKGEILDAALEVFAVKGYDGGSMREVAELVGVTEPALYRHFDSKRDMFLALMRSAGARMRTEALGIIGAMEASRLRDQLVGAFADRRRVAGAYAVVLRTVMAASTHHPGFLNEFRASFVQPVAAALAAKTEELDVAFGHDSTPEERAARVRAVIALLVGYFITSVVMADELDETIADAFLSVMGWEGAA